MPSLKDSRKTIKTSILDVEDSEVILWDEMTMGDFDDIRDTESAKERGGKAVLYHIKEWNLDEPLTLENVSLLTDRQANHLLEQTKWGRDLKKGREKLEEEVAEKKKN